MVFASSRVICLFASAFTFCSMETLPPSLTSASEPPAIFDGTTRLYIAYICPYAQRTWIARNYKGLQEKIELVPIDLQNRPAWYKEKIYPANKVPSLEHNNEVRGESLDLVKYIDSHFEGPALMPDDPAKQQFAEELLLYSDSFNMVMYKAMPAKGNVSDEVDVALNKIEDAFSKFSDGPFLLGKFSLVDIAYAPFIDRFQTFFLDVKNYDITKGRPNLSSWIEELNKIDAYSQTRIDPQELLAATKKRFGIA
ncbi:protein IN2-1 homolog B-like isoform X1 [Musa acuminata AAA Group]|uniref:protein IN2-1 homolog B-like isoform X1 n=1 Tax=Musa acuminata AAA Group TaxID=214697 RepID=UPI0031E3C5D5